MHERESSETPPFVGRTISRRQALGLGVAGLAAVAFPLPIYEGFRIAEKQYGLVTEFNDTWHAAKLTTDEFLNRYEQQTSHVRFAASFAPEKFGVTLEQGLSAPLEFSKNQKRAEDALDFLIHDLGVTDIRIGIRWNNTIHANGTFDPSIYAPFLEKCFKNDVDVTLDIGPIKNQRWPEQHVPESVLLNLSDLPPFGAVITPDMQLSSESMEHLTQVLSWLKVKYKDYEDQIVAFNPENEGLGNFGDKEWSVSEAHLTKVVGRIHDAFQNADILLNSSGGDQLSKIREIGKNLIALHPKLAHKMRSGINYYYLTPHLRSIPFLDTPFKKADRILIDQATTFFGEDEYSKHAREAEKMGMTEEISEGQAERWYPFLFPEYELQGLQFMTLRTAPYTSAINRFWGSEPLAANVLYGKDPGPRKMAKFIAKVNGGRKYPKYVY